MNVSRYVGCDVFIMCLVAEEPGEGERGEAPSDLHGVSGDRHQGVGGKQGGVGVGRWF